MMRRSNVSVRSALKMSWRNIPLTLDDIFGANAVQADYARGK